MKIESDMHPFAMFLFLCYCRSNCICIKSCHEVDYAIIALCIVLRFKSTYSNDQGLAHQVSQNLTIGGNKDVKVSGVKFFCSVLPTICHDLFQTVLQYKFVTQIMTVNVQINIWHRLIIPKYKAKCIIYQNHRGGRLNYACYAWLLARQT